MDNAHSWCRPCKILSPILKKLASDADFRTGSGRPIDLITVDSDVHRALAEEKYDVRPRSLARPTRKTRCGG
jgi:thioredoxin 1